MTDGLSRRALFTAGVAAIAGIVARAVPVAAASEPVLLGERNRSATTTTIVQDDRALSLVGGAANVRLVPSNLHTHPHKGMPGDLVVDRSRRLWFCRSEYDWVRLA